MQKRCDFLSIVRSTIMIQGKVSSKVLSIVQVLFI